MRLLGLIAAIHFSATADAGRSTRATAHGDVAAPDARVTTPAGAPTDAPPSPVAADAAADVDVRAAGRVAGDTAPGQQPAAGAPAPRSPSAPGLDLDAVLSRRRAAGE